MVQGGFLCASADAVIRRSAPATPAPARDPEPAPPAHLPAHINGAHSPFDTSALKSSLESIAPHTTTSPNRPGSKHQSTTVPALSLPPLAGSTGLLADFH
jgi:hypothetical protein